MKNYYDLLGVSPTASEAEIKQAYRRLSIKFHPDKNEGDAYFEEMFKQINEAQEVLLDHTKRGAYNAKLNSFAQQQARVASEQARLRREREELQRKQREQELTAQRLKSQEEALWQQRAAATKPAPVVTTPVTTPAPVRKPQRRKESLSAKARRWKRYKIAWGMINLGLALYLFFGPKKLHYFRPPGTDAYVAAEKGIFLREKPQSTSKALASLPVYTYLKVVSDHGPVESLGLRKAAWYQVSTDSLQGWVWSGYINRIKK
ncbi:SH3 domain-containing protein [Hymenobacter arizonensis]|uniref:SH3 domain-containing protein n=1 Tax=Hymenobacter arizonensis TaxID=1227077 RepID=A0A1I5YX08_HYMAR|nr:SH3 domain-containing protein [Hymenobacter arizonensis]SFQ48766.1 SH3 domain-containing protein [Hymenobacter arizonensis]